MEWRSASRPLTVVLDSAPVVGHSNLSKHVTTWRWDCIFQLPSHHLTPSTTLLLRSRVLLPTPRAPWFSDRGCGASICRPRLSGRWLQSTTTLHLAGRTLTLSPDLLSPELGCVFQLMERCCLIASISSLVMAPTVMCVMGMMAAWDSMKCCRCSHLWGVIMRQASFWVF